MVHLGAALRHVPTEPSRQLWPNPQDQLTCHAEVAWIYGNFCHEPSQIKLSNMVSEHSEIEASHSHKRIQKDFRLQASSSTGAFPIAVNRHVPPKNKLKHHLWSMFSSYHPTFGISWSSKPHVWGWPSGALAGSEFDPGPRVARNIMSLWASIGIVVSFYSWEIVIEKKWPDAIWLHQSAGSMYIWLDFMNFTAHTGINSAVPRSCTCKKPRIGWQIMAWLAGHYHEP